MNEPKGSDERAAAGQRAKPVPPGKSGLPQPDWDSGEVLMTPLPPPVGGPQGQMHTWSHNLNSMNLLVDAKLGGTQQPGPDGLEPIDRDAHCARRSEQVDVPVVSGRGVMGKVPKLVWDNRAAETAGVDMAF